MRKLLARIFLALAGLCHCGGEERQAPACVVGGVARTCEGARSVEVYDPPELGGTRCGPFGCARVFCETSGELECPSGAYCDAVLEDGTEELGGACR